MKTQGPRLAVSTEAEFVKDTILYRGYVRSGVRVEVGGHGGPRGRHGRRQRRDARRSLSQRGQEALGSPGRT